MCGRFVQFDISLPAIVNEAVVIKPSTITRNISNNQH